MSDPEARPLLTQKQQEDLPHEHHTDLGDVVHAVGRVAGPGRIVGFLFLLLSPFLAGVAMMSIMIYDSPIKSKLDECLRFCTVLFMALLPVSSFLAGIALIWTNKLLTWHLGRIAVPVVLYPVFPVGMVMVCLMLNALFVH